jgi:excisionase family DNA binding protein
MSKLVKNRMEDLEACPRPEPEGRSVWMTTAEAASYLKIKPRTLLKWVREGSIKAWPLHGTTRKTWRFRKEDLDSALGFDTTQAADSVLSSSTSSVALQREGIA